MLMEGSNSHTAMHPSRDLDIRLTANRHAISGT
jgi:hypothetical protein